MVKKHWLRAVKIDEMSENDTFLTKIEMVDWQTWENHVKNWSKVSKLTILAFLAQKASKVIISLFSGFWDSSMKMRGQFLSKGGTQSWPGTAIVNHPLRHENDRRLSYFPYIFYFVNFTISAAIRQGLFGSFETWEVCNLLCEAMRTAAVVPILPIFSIL